MLVELYILQLLHTSLSFEVGHLLIPTSGNGEFISSVGKAASIPDSYSAFPRLLRFPQLSAVGGFLVG